MGEILRVIKKVSPLILSIFIFSCSGEDQIPVANFDTSKIEGEYTVNMKLDYFGPRPTVSVFNGSLTVDMTNANNFNMAIIFPSDFLTANLDATIVEKIVANSNSAIGGISFIVDETTDYKGNPDKIEVTTRDGIVKKAYAIFIDSGELEMTLHLIETGDNPTELEITARKIE